MVGSNVVTVTDLSLPWTMILYSPDKDWWRHDTGKCSFSYITVSVDFL